MQRTLTIFLLIVASAQILGQSIGDPRYLVYKKTNGETILVTGEKIPGKAANDIPNDFIKDRMADRHSYGMTSTRGRINNGEFLIDTTVDYVPRYGTQTASACAFDGTNHLVVWQDNFYLSMNGENIYAARIDQNGSVLDPLGIPICESPNDQLFPAVAFDGENYMVVWGDYRSGLSGIYFARVDTNGAVLDPGGILVTPNHGFQGAPSIAFDGCNYMIVWNTESDIYGARISKSGVVIDPNGIAIDSSIDRQMAPAISYHDSCFFVIWMDYRNTSSNDCDIYGARVTKSGIVLDPAGIPICTEPARQVAPSVSAGDSAFFVVWSDSRGSIDCKIYGARVDLNGNVRDSAGIRLSNEDNSQSYPVLSFDGTNYLVAWQGVWKDTTTNIYARRIDRSGVIIDTAVIAISEEKKDQGYPAICFSNDHFLTVWSDCRNTTNGVSSIYGTRVGTSGAVLDPGGVCISTEAGMQSHPSVASDSINYFVVWDERHGYGNSDVYGMRLDPSGAPLDQIKIAIASTPGTNSYSKIAFGADIYLVVWNRLGIRFNAYGSRVSRSGGLLDTVGIPLSSSQHDQYHPVCSYDGLNFLTAWMDWRVGSDWNIYGTRISPAGIVLDTAGIPISVAQGEEYLPAITFGKDKYLLAWEHLRSDTTTDIHASFVNTAGMVLDSSGIVLCDAANWQENPSLAFDGINYMAVWDDRRSGIYYDIYGTLIDSAGKVLDTLGFIVSAAPYSQGNVSIVCDGDNYYCSWSDTRSYTNLDVYGAQLNTNGLVLDSFAVCSRPRDQYFPAMAVGPSKKVLVVYCGWADSVNGHPVNTMRIWGKFCPLTGVENRPAAGRIATVKTYLEKGYPNPFTNRVDISYQIGMSSPVRLEVYNITGQLLRTLVNEAKAPGRYSVHWDGRLNDGKQAASGVYLCHLTTSDCLTTSKIIKLR